MRVRRRARCRSPALPGAVATLPAVRTIRRARCGRSTERSTRGAGEAPPVSPPVRAERQERPGGAELRCRGRVPALGAGPRGLGGGRVYCSPRGACRARLSPQHGVALSAVCVRRARDAGLRAGTAAPGAPRSAAAAVATRRSSLLPAAPRLSGAQAAGDAPAPALPPPWAGSGTRLASALRSPPALRAMGSPAAASAAAATDSAQWLSVKEETIFLHDGLIRVTDLAELPSEIIGVAEPGDTELEVRRPPELRGGTGQGRE